MVHQNEDSQRPAIAWRPTPSQTESAKARHQHTAQAHSHQGPLFPLTCRLVKKGNKNLCDHAQSPTNGCRRQTAHSPNRTAVMQNCAATFTSPGQLYSSLLRSIELFYNTRYTFVCMRTISPHFHVSFMTSCLFPPPPVKTMINSRLFILLWYYCSLVQ